MLLLTDALRIALGKVAQSIVNIFIFRYMFAVSKIFMQGFFGFIVTVFLMNKIKSFAIRFWTGVRRNMLIKQGREEEAAEFDAKHFSRLDMDACNVPDDCVNSTILTTLCQVINKNSQSDLFSYIFSSASQSSLLSLLVILSIEHLNSSLQYNLIYSILYCVSLAFILAFGSSLRYMNLIGSGGARSEKSSSSSPSLLISRKHLVMYKQDFVCQVESSANLAEREITIEFKNLSANYSSRIDSLVVYYIKTHVNIDEGQENVISIFDKCQVIVPDYYNFNFVFTNGLKKCGMTKTESWTEFRLCPLVDFGVSVFRNIDSKKKNKV